MMALQRICCKEIIVYARADAEEDDACGADSQGQTGAATGRERRQGAVGLLDVHGLDNEQIVLE